MSTMGYFVLGFILGAALMFLIARDYVLWREDQDE